jgi:putative lipoic acid-binding regulatory protein
MSFIVIDNFFSDPDKERTAAIEADYTNIDHDGYSYPGMVQISDPDSVKKIVSELGESMPKAVTTIYRRYLPHDVQATYIHNDSNIGTYSAVVFLNTAEQCEGSGLAFWQHKETGWYGQPTAQEFAPTGLVDSPALWQGMVEQGMDERRWNLVAAVPMKYNRCVVFDSSKYHSRYPQQAIGEDVTTSRLIKVFFLKY